MVIRTVKLEKKASSIWLGPRQSGKSTWIREELKNTTYFEVDLLEIDTYRKYLREPSQLAKDIEYQIKKNNIKFVFIDEFQKIPELTNEVHRLIEKYKVHFVLSGSSARKIKYGNANLLGGRAIIIPFFSLTVDELKSDFNLEEILQYGSLVGIYFNERTLKIQKLKSYIETYLKEEIAQEGLVRNFELFHRFLDVAAAYGCEIINYANISREASISLKTVQNYFSILYETLLAYSLAAWDKSVKRQLSKSPKMYFSDNGIMSALNKNLNDPLLPQIRGKMFEQWFINEVRAVISYSQSEVELHFWRTERGEHEIDLILSKHKKPIVAIEIKAKKKIFKTDYSSLLEFQKDYPKCPSYCVSEVTSSYQESGVTIMTAVEFINKELNRFI